MKMFTSKLFKVRFENGSMFIDSKINEPIYIDSWPYHKRDTDPILNPPPTHMVGKTPCWVVAKDKRRESRYAVLFSMPFETVVRSNDLYIDGCEFHTSDWMWISESHIKEI